MKGYHNVKQMGKTGMSTLYFGEKDTEDISSLSFLIKKYDANVLDEMIENERTISQTIEENCSCSVIIPILESIRDDDGRYAVMQFRKNGVFLNEIIERLEENYGEKNIPLSVILSITSRILESLAVFHTYESQGKETGYLHLDLNPGNIFFESADVRQQDWGTVKLIDFGSSVMRQEKDEILSKRNWHCYSEEYSPEELKDRTISHIGTGTDLYSVCACMVRMMEGKAFSGFRSDRIEAILKLMSYQTAWMANELAGRDHKREFEEFLCHCEKSSWNRLNEEAERRGTIAHILNHEYC